MNLRIAIVLPCVTLAMLASCERPAPKPTATDTASTAPAATPAETVHTPPAPTPTAPAIEPQPAKPVFLPSKHGFAFVNAFRGSPLPPSLRGLKSVLGSQVPERFGLCGGMCMAAADFFHASVEIPSDAVPPVEGDPLYQYLYDRQLDSFGGIALPLRVLQLMAAPDAGPDGLQALTAKELPRIREKVASGDLVPICIILGKADGRSKPWDNHQILIYADATSDEAAPVLRVYDPNFPKDDLATLTFAKTDDGWTTLLQAHRPGRPKPTEIKVRGLFLTPYTPRTPSSAPTKKKSAD
jgi:hypothetical protein